MYKPSRLFPLLLALVLMVIQMGPASADPELEPDLQSGYICGHCEGDVIPAGMTGYMVDVFVTCSNERYRWEAFCGVSDVCTGACRIYDPVLVPTDQELQGGRVTQIITGFSHAEPIAGCSECDSLPPPPSPPTVDFRADRDTIQRGECTTLRWDVENVVAVELDGEGVVGHDSRQVCPEIDTEYVLRVVTHSGDIYRAVTIKVLEPPQQQPEVQFWAEPDAIEQGQCATLIWDVEHATSVYLDGEGVSAHGTRQVCPQRTTEYTLSVIAPIGDLDFEQLHTALVTVRDPAAPPVPPTLPAPPPLPPAPPTLPAAPPLPPAPPGVDRGQVEALLKEKEALIAGLQLVDIPTDLFPLVAVGAYDESAAKHLLGRTREELANGTLSQEQAEAFARLTLHEQALARLLPTYSNVAAYLTDTGASLVETGFGLYFSFKSAASRCPRFVPLCGRLPQATERLMLRIVTDFGRIWIRGAIREPQFEESGLKAWELMITLTEAQFAKGDSLLEVLKDYLAETAATTALVKLYVIRNQPLLEKGVRSADQAETDTDRWPITGTTDRAGLLLNEMLQKAVWEEDLARSRHEDWERYADVARFAEDIADLGRLSPLRALAVAAGLVVRSEEFAVATVMGLAEYNNLVCIDYFTRRAAEMSFDSAQPGEDCRYRNSASGPRLVTWVAYHPADARLQPRLAALQAATDGYRTALQLLLQSVEGGDSLAAEQAYDQLLQADEDVARPLNEMGAILLAGEELDNAEANFLSTALSLHTRTLVICLAAAENLLAAHENAIPQVDLRAAVDRALVTLDLAEQQAAGLDLSLPPGLPVLLIPQAAASRTGGKDYDIVIDVANVGTAQASKVELALQGGGQELVPRQAIGDLAAGKTQAVTLSISEPASALFQVQAWQEGRLVDTYAGSLPSLPLPNGQPGPLVAALLMLVAVVVGASSGMVAVFRSHTRRATRALLVIKGPSQSLRLTIGQQAVMLGRSRSCQVILTDPWVSREHILIGWEHGGHFARDLGSRNGMFVNGAPVRQIALRPGDVIVIGQTSLHYLSAGIGAEPDAARAPH